MRIEWLSFADRQRVGALVLEPGDDLDEGLQRLGLGPPRPTLVLIGGADGLGASAAEDLRPLFLEVLAPLAQELGAFVVDGGTDAGVMRLMGEARRDTAASFPLIGVAPVETVVLPDARESSGIARLEPHHTHFVLIPGSGWGDESPWIARVSDSLSAGRPSVAVLLDGGAISERDLAASVAAGRRVIVAAGSGRLADRLANAADGGDEDPEVRALADSHLVRAVRVDRGPAALAAEVRRALTVGVGGP
jgi:hypothetical protein